MSERKLFWLGFIGGIMRIFAILQFLFAAYAAIGVWGLANWRGVPPLLIIVVSALSLYALGKRFELISDKGNGEGDKINPN